MNERRTIVLLLSAIAVLLTLNLMRPTGGDAHAGGVSDGEPYVVKYLPKDAIRHWRVWSDGLVEYRDCPGDECDCTTPVSFSGDDHPFPVVDAVFTHNGTAIWLVYEDGRRDMVTTTKRCTLVGSGGQPVCTGDLDRSGDVGFSDLLVVLAAWGVCE